MAHFILPALHKHRRKRRILWVEAIGFSIIIGLTWISELTHLPHVLFDEPFAPNLRRAVLRTIVIVLAWIWVNWETRRLLQRLHQLEGFLLVCAWCRRIGDDAKWVTTEKYFGTRFDTRTSHAMCPECSEKALANMPPATD